MLRFLALPSLLMFLFLAVVSKGMLLRLAQSQQRRKASACGVRSRVECYLYILFEEEANSRHSATELLVSWAGVAAVAAPTGKQHSAEVHCVSNEFVELGSDLA